MGSTAGGIIGSGVGIAAWATATTAEITTADSLGTQLGTQLASAGGRLLTGLAGGMVTPLVHSTVGSGSSGSLQFPDPFHGSREANVGGVSCWYAGSEYFSTGNVRTNSGDTVIDTRVDTWQCADGSSMSIVRRG